MVLTRPGSRNIRGGCLAVLESPRTAGVPPGSKTVTDPDLVSSAGDRVLTGATLPVRRPLAALDPATYTPFPLSTIPPGVRARVQCSRMGPHPWVLHLTDPPCRLFKSFYLLLLRVQGGTGTVPLPTSSRLRYETVPTPEGTLMTSGSRRSPVVRVSVPSGAQPAPTPTPVLVGSLRLSLANG